MKIQLIAATAAFALVGAAAMAQEKSTSVDSSLATPPAASADPMIPPAATDPAAQPMAPPATDASATVTSTTTTDSLGASVTTSTVTNGPVPDTAENRARYGQPMSNAGKRTKATGN